MLTTGNPIIDEWPREDPTIDELAERERDRGAFRCYNFVFHQLPFGAEGDTVNCHACLFLEDKLFPYCGLTSRGIELVVPTDSCPYAVFPEDSRFRSVSVDLL